MSKPATMRICQNRDQQCDTEKGAGASSHKCEDTDPKAQGGDAFPQKRGN